MASRIVYKDFIFYDTDINSAECFIVDSLIVDELAFDTFDCIVFSNNMAYYLLTSSEGYVLESTEGHTLYAAVSDEPITDFVYADPVYYYHNDELIGKFYLKYIHRVGPNSFKFKCISGMGVLEQDRHNGGMYDGDTAADVIDDIIGDTLTYTIDEEIASLPLFGWLPEDTRRANLHQVLFALGASIGKDASGDIRITFLTNATSTPVASTRFYQKGSVEYREVVSGVDVTEHTFLALTDDDEKTLFDNTGGGVAADGETVIFDGPYHDLTVDGSLTIDEEGVNYAVITGTGTLTGQAYTHQKKIISERAETTGKPNIVTVEDMTLISVANSENVSARLLSFYTGAFEIANDMTVGTERPGDLLTFEDPFYDEATAFLKSLDITHSRTLAAAARFIQGYDPQGYGNYYDNVVLLTGSGTWTVPADVENIRAVLIGGGQGGWSGNYGEGGSTSGPGDGGEGGEPGAGGSILNTRAEVTPGSGIAYNCGTGGAGGAPDSAESIEGTLGTATTFGSYSSADGIPGANGFLDVFTGTRYGYEGDNGQDGGAGSSYTEDGPDVLYDETTYHPGTQGADFLYGGHLYVGGCGGGAAPGANGGGGGTVSIITVYIGGSPALAAVGGVGGTGGAGEDGDDATQYGVGGQGGHAGGGGGQSTSGMWLPNNSSPGAGGTGGAGAAGAILIYY